MLPDLSNITMNSTDGNTTNKTCASYRDNPSPVDEPKASQHFRTTFLAFILFFSIVGNGLVLRGAILRRNRPFVYYLVINLSVAEILNVVMWSFLMVERLPPFLWVFGDFLCHFFTFCNMCAVLVVTFTLATIAVFRAIVIIHPKRNRPSKKFAYSLMAISWIWGTCFAIREGLNYKLQLFPDPCIPGKVLKSCSAVDETPVFDSAYFFAFFLVPFVLMLASYGIVICKIKRHIHSEEAKRECIEMVKVTSTRGSSMEMKAPTVQPLQESPPNNPNVLPVGQRRSMQLNESKIFKLENDVLNLLYILILVFFVCFLPWTIMYILMQVAKEPNVSNWSYRVIFSWYITLLQSLPTALHPICYGVASKVIDINFRLPCNKVMRE